MTDAASNVTTIGYDARGHKASLADPNMGSWAYEHNAYGELRRQRSPMTSAPSWTVSLNRYSYVWNNPLTLVDPSGFQGTADDRGEEQDGQWVCIVFNLSCPFVTVVPVDQPGNTFVGGNADDGSAGAGSAFLVLGTIARQTPQGRVANGVLVGGGALFAGSLLVVANSSVWNSLRRPEPYFAEIIRPKSSAGGSPVSALDVSSPASPPPPDEDEIVASASTETFYRTMSQTDYEQLLATGRVQPGAETFISPSLEYASKFNGVTVQFVVRAGTREALLGMGVRHPSLGGDVLGGLPLAPRGWGSSSAMFKLEEGVMNIGLGRGSALNTFNGNIVRFGKVQRP